jgi:hypothetical protein
MLLVCDPQALDPRQDVEYGGGGGKHTLCLLHPDGNMHMALSSMRLLLGFLALFILASEAQWNGNHAVLCDGTETLANRGVVEYAGIYQFRRHAQWLYKTFLVRST